MSIPILPLRVWPSGSNNASVPANDNSLRIEALNRPALGFADDAGSGNLDGDVWIVGPSPSGDFASFEQNDITIYKESGSGGQWYAWQPVEGIRLVVDGVRMVYGAGSSASWAIDSSGESVSADLVTYDNASSGLTADNVQDAIDELAAGGGGSGTVTSVDASGGTTGLTFTGGPIETSGTLTLSGTLGLANGGIGVSLVDPNADRLFFWDDSAGAFAFLTLGTNLSIAGTTINATGGSGLTNFTEALSVAAPNGAINVASLTPSTGTTDVDIALVPKGNGAVLADIPDGLAAGGNKRGNNAVDFQTQRTLNTEVASGPYSCIPGGERNTASGNYSYAANFRNTVNGQSAAGFGNQNTVSGANSFCAGGTTTTVSGIGAVNLGGGGSNTSSGTSSITSGALATASQSYSQAHGLNVNANADHSYARGTRSHTFARVGTAVFSTGQFSTDGDNQSVDLGGLRSNTTDATLTTLTTNAGAATTTNQLVLQNNQCATFTALVTARQNTTGDTKGWRLSGLIKRTANAASTSIVGAVDSLSWGDAGAAAWTAVAVADTTNGALAIRVTGEAAKNIKWACRIIEVEVMG